MLFASNLGSELVMCLSAHEYCKKINEKNIFTSACACYSNLERERCVCFCVCLCLCACIKMQKKNIFEKSVFYFSVVITVTVL